MGRPEASRRRVAPVRRVGTAAVGAAVAALVGILTGPPVSAAPSSSPFPPAPSSSTLPPPPPGPFYLALGDSLAYGAQPSGIAHTNGYVYDLAAAEAAIHPGLQLENLACSGETTTSFVKDSLCASEGGSQLAAAEAFLGAHKGEVSFITLDIGANDVDGCIAATSVNVTCMQSGLMHVAENLRTIYFGITQAAGPSVPIYVMNYYDPFLGEWVKGGNNQTLAGLSLTGLELLNGIVDDTAGSFGATIVDVASAFHSFDSTLSGTYGGQTVPVDVAIVCQLTWYCSQRNVHADDDGYTLIAQTFEDAIGRAASEAGPGMWLASADGGVFALGSARYHGSASQVPHSGTVAGIAPTPDGAGYWLVSTTGGVYAFGDAGFFGSRSGFPNVGAVAGIASTPDGRGYWLVTAEGEVASFGDALSLGFPLGSDFPGTVVALVPTTDGCGYWLVTSAGGVYAYGDAVFAGAPITSGPAAPVVAGSGRPDENGYWVAGADGGVYAFGSAPFLGSLERVLLASPVVGSASD